MIALWWLAQVLVINWCQVGQGSIKGEKQHIRDMSAIFGRDAPIWPFTYAYVFIVGQYVILNWTNVSFVANCNICEEEICSYNCGMNLFLWRNIHTNPCFSLFCKICPFCCGVFAVCVLHHQNTAGWTNSLLFVPLAPSATQSCLNIFLYCTLCDHITLVAWVWEPTVHSNTAWTSWLALLAVSFMSLCAFRYGEIPTSPLFCY